MVFFLLFYVRTFTVHLWTLVFGQSSVTRTEVRVIMPSELLFKLRRLAIILKTSWFKIIGFFSEPKHLSTHEKQKHFFILPFFVFYKNGCPRKCFKGNIK